MIAIGIDIGKTGAVAAVDHRSCAVHDMPLRDGLIDAIGLRDVLRNIVRPGEPCIVLVEALHAMPRNGSIASFSLGRSAGTVAAVLALQRLTTHAVQPRAWKEHFGLIGADKHASRVKATERCPTASHHLTRAKDHNRAEALLLARYALEVLT